MPRLVRDARIETREARRRLPAQAEPHWRAIVQGAHVGYYKGARKGTWILRWRKPEGGYRKETLGPADDVRDADGVSVLDFRQAQAEALRRVASWEGGADRADPNPGPVTVASAIADYLTWIQRHRRPTTAREWGYMARAHILPELGDVDITKLTARRIRQWHEAIADAPARLRTRPGKPQRRRETGTDPDAVRARRATANRVLTVLKAALNHAHREGKATTADAWQRVKPFQGAEAARVRFLSQDECRRLLNACAHDFRLLVRAALVTGCRYGELCRAEVRDFSIEGKALHVREGKGGKPRWVPLDDEAAAFVSELAAGRSSEQRLFLRADGNDWGKSQQARPLLEACNAALIVPAANFHCLRHTWASHRVMRGMPLLAVAQVLGHTDTRMVERHYGHLAPSWLHAEIRRTAMDLGPQPEAAVVQLRAGGRGPVRPGGR